MEGGFHVWLKEENLIYFILRADPRPELEEYNRRLDEEDKEDISSGFYSYIGRLPTGMTSIHCVYSLSLCDMLYWS